MRFYQKFPLLEKMGNRTAPLKEMETKIAKCPYCNNELTEDDVYDATTDRTDDGRFAVVHNIVGHCDECGKEFQWEEIYAFEEARKVVEV